MAFERLVDAVYEGRALPFVGAGLSVGADYKGKGDKPTTQSLTKRLARHLHRKAKSCPKTRRFLDGSVGKPNPGPQRIAELTLPWLAQHVATVEGEPALCRLLKIERFRELEPTPAHRYLAFLAREGLVAEIITTNYDLCLEKAFDQSIPGGDRAAPDHRLSVVTDKASYAKRSVGGNPCLTIYKINGSAAEYNPSDPDTAKRIILTDLDLQAWHGEHWARRLFTDRLGHKAVALSGFGGEEAQVRFAMTELTRELSAASAWSAVESASPPPITPFIQEWKTSLNPYQRQVIDLWATHGEHHGFSGEQAPFFRLDGQDKLPADRFWEAVYAASMRRLLRRELESGVTASFLSAMGWFPALLAESACRELFSSEDGRCDDAAFLTLSKDHVLPWSRYVDAARGIDSPGAGRYDALREQPLLLGLLVLFLACWPGSAGSVPGATTLGLRLRGGDAAEGVEIWLARSPERPAAAAGGADDSIVFVQIALFTDDGILYDPAMLGRRAWPLRTLTSDGEVTRRYGVGVDARVLLKLAAGGATSPGTGAGDDWSRLRGQLSELVQRPWLWYDETRPSYRDRTFELGEYDA